jgi:hypothetical protein
LSIRNKDLANGRNWNCHSGGSQKQCTSGPSLKNKIRLPAFSSVLAKHDASRLAKTVSSSRQPPPTNYGTPCSEYGSNLLNQLPYHKAMLRSLDGKAVCKKIEESVLKVLLE